MSAAIQPAVDTRSPWLGLASFTEETRAYFFGREEEVAELARRVQRKLLTVLFGQSGLGKTSILRAGLVPKLRTQGYCPVYVRIDYAPEAPEPAEQIKQAIAQTARGSGEWTQAGVAATGESLWEFLHHRDDVLKDESGQTLIPLVIFDQFEEIFTLAQNDDAGRARAARFIQDLADLVENRPPPAVEARLESDDGAADRFDFGRSDYRVLIALREDYLAPLESLKRSMPSIAQNRLRLAPMNGQQALAAVLKPGKGLVNEEVAAAIVRFVAGGAELQNAEVEPALLSLVCRELNDARIAAGRNEISPDLLEGSQGTILSNFYERSLADQPAGVRRIVEDQLLTASGFRENIAEERLLAAFREAGVPPDTLAVLVNRRLLRVEERLDLRRVELTHDVLCTVVKESRDLRRAQEAREASDRLLAEQREKELAARNALVRARQIAIGCALLAVVAIGAAVLAVISTQRAKRAEAATQQARVQSEALVGYLSDDFATQLETYGQLATIAEITRRQIDYFHGLPPSLKGPQSIHNGALAMISFASAQRNLGDAGAGEKAAREAITLLEQERSTGDRSEEDTIALARAYAALANLMSQTADPAGVDTGKKARALIAPIASKPNASPNALKAYASVLTILGYLQSQFEKELDDAVKNLRTARDIAASLGGREIKTHEVAAMYVSAAVWECEILRLLGRTDEAEAIDQEADGIARKILEQRPDYRRTLHDAEIIELDLALAAQSNLDPASGVESTKRSRDLAVRLLQLDPQNTSSINNASIDFLTLGDLSWSVGDVNGFFDYYRQAKELYTSVEGVGAWSVLNSLNPMAWLGLRRADAGQDAEAQKVSEEAESTVAKLKRTNPNDAHMQTFAQCALRDIRASIAKGRLDLKTQRALGGEAQDLVRDLEPTAPFEEYMKYNCVIDGPLLQGDADLWSGDYAAAVSDYQTALKAKAKYPPGAQDVKRETSMAKVLESLALVHTGHTDEARTLIAPEFKFQSELAARNKGDVTQLMDLAQTLYVESLLDAPHAVALRAQAAGLIAKMPPQYRALRTVTRWRNLIQGAH